MPTSLYKHLFLTLLFTLTLQARDIDLNALNAQAVKQNKHLFVFLHRTDCGYCDSMLQFTFDDDRVTPLLETSFLFVHINIFDEDSVAYKSFKGSGREFARFIGYDVYPSSLFFSADNTLVLGIPGYRDEKKFLKILTYIHNHIYTQMEFEQYEESDNAAQ